MILVIFLLPRWLEKVSGRTNDQFETQGISRDTIQAGLIMKRVREPGMKQPAMVLTEWSILSISG
jgi:hypothetical protein